ncbi:MAG TPA: hypothetical protein VN951_04345 [Pyrinomonadaceae bacterium]|nr:hypothetical protein [Pyrinomonadaceae bacterium]
MPAAICNGNLLTALGRAAAVSGCGDLVKGMINLAGRSLSDFASNAVWKAPSSVGS